MGVLVYLLLTVCLFSLRTGYSAHYFNYTLSNENICKATILGLNVLDVGKDSNSGLIIKQTFHFDNWPTNAFDCKFTVKANYNMGLFAVIQKMSLRQNVETKDCIDFIQFRRSSKKYLSINLDMFRGDQSWEPKYCGKLDKFHEAESDVTPPSDLMANAFLSLNGSIDVKFHVGKTKLEPNQSVDIEVAFTAFIKCKDSRGAYRYCGRDTCIYKEYFKDRVVNCPYIHCVDENGCSEYAVGDGTGGFELNTRVTVTATTSIFLSFFLFLGCIWLCRYFDMLCWSSEPSQATTSAPLAPPPPTVELTPVPSAPSPDSSDKDLPPAYETLFPER